MENSTSNHGKLDNDEELFQSKGINIERIRNAKKQRILQMKRWTQYDKLKEKLENNRQRKGYPTSRKGPKSVRFCQNLILLEAGNSGDADEVRRLLSEGVCADVANGDGLTALHQSAINKNIEMSRILIHYKANVNSKDKELWTPLHAAAICGHAEICQLLIKNGADPLALNTDANMPYDICEDETTLDIIENEMAAKGITQDQVNEARNLPELNMLNDVKAVVGRLGQSVAVQLFSQLDKQGANQLHIASACGYVTVIRLLLSIGMPVDGLDKDGWQAIHIASLYCHLEVIEVLVSHGANIDSQTKQGETVYELVYDGEVYEKLLLLKQEVDKLKKNENLTSSIGLVRRRSSTNPRSASIRRTSMKDKSFLSWKEARQEAEIRLSIERKSPQDNNNAISNNILSKENNNRESLVNSSLRTKHFPLNESIAETDYADTDSSNVDPNQIELDINDSSKVWALPGLANRIEKPNFTHPHPYNSPTRDPNTFPYIPKTSINSNSNNKSQRDSLSKILEPPLIKPREVVPSKKVEATIKLRETIPSKQGDNNQKPVRDYNTIGKAMDGNKPRQSSDTMKANIKKGSTLPHTFQEADDIIDTKPISQRLPKPQPKSPSTTHRQLNASRTSVNSIKTGSSSHTTPITTPRSSQISEHRKSNRQSIKAIKNNNNNNNNNNKKGKLNRPDSCCSMM